MDKFIQIFIDFIPNDKEFVKELIPRYEQEFRTLGIYIEQHSISLNCIDSEFMEELFDFLDGNGFEVIRPKIKNPYDTHPIQLIPIYIEKTTLEEEIKETNERLKAAIKKIQSAVSEYVLIQTRSLFYTPVEMDEGPVFEYEKLLASWAFWLRVCRRVELLRLVPEGRCGSASVPRPP